MGPSPKYHPPKGEGCETSVEHSLPLWAENAVGYCSRRPRPSPMWGSRFVGAREVGPWVGEQKPLGKTPLRGNHSPQKIYLPTFRVEILQRTIDRIENHCAPEMQQEVVVYVNKSRGAVRAKLSNYESHVARFDSGLHYCRDKVGQVLRMFSTLVHLEQFEKVVRQMDSVE